MATLSFLSYLRGIYDLNLNNTSEVHKAVIESIYDSFIMAEGDVNQMRLELSIKTATGYWLDCWGDYFAVQRKLNEPDNEYADRIITSVISPKSTIPAIKDHMISFLNSRYGTHYTRKDISIKEPWRDIAKYSHKGTLSNDARYFSGDYYCHAIMDISVPEPEYVDKDLIDLVNAVKAGGVKVIWSIINDYDIPTEFYVTDNVKADYLRHIETKVQRNIFSGLVLSNSSPRPVLSGTKQIWFEGRARSWELYAKMQGHNTDQSVTLTTVDLFKLIYTLVETVLESDTEITDTYVSIDDSTCTVLVDGSENYVFKDHTRDAFHLNDITGALSVKNKVSGDKIEINSVEKITVVTETLLDTLKILDTFAMLSKQGRLSADSSLQITTEANGLYTRLLKALNKFKVENREYYDSAQAPIERINGDRCMWYVQRKDNWLWNTPCITHKDLIEKYSPLDTNREYTINDIVEFEDKYRKQYITFGDSHQPPIRVGEKEPQYTLSYKQWLFDSPTLLIEDLPEIYRKQFKYVPNINKADNPDCTLEEIFELEENYNREGYSVVGDNDQGRIEIKQ